ncbi:hypothetical protein C8R42DRAFT_593768 [Lentinula raphanica]|nr:hypothetical protein C8R42DRAFT_593768 [Lentinula raphanica]
MPSHAYSQRFPLPIPEGQVGFRYRPQTSDNVDRAPVVHTDVSEHITSVDSVGGGSESHHKKKRFAQFRHWNDEIIPTLVRPYLHLLRVSNNLAEDTTWSTEECVCLNKSRKLDIVVVRFHKLERISLQICSCRPAAKQLIERALFGCAPLYPSLAVDLRVLDFVNRLFLRISPNNTAICDTLEDFLKAQGFHLQGQDPLRRRFSNALQWYNTLLQVSTSYIDRVVEEGRSSGIEDRGPTVDREEAEQDRSKRSRVEEEEPMRERPSEYLRRRCPLCFGGSSPLTQDRFSLSRLSCIVCLDACFTQKNNTRTYRDPHRVHPRTVFIPEGDVDSWQHFVDSVRPKTNSSDSGVRTELDSDGYEGSLKVPKSVLDGCENSFIAADGARTKASTKFFDSTGLMGLLCRHDRVLWLVNITTAGERQHYAFSLIDMLFKHLPSSYTVGLLYDIACQLERSCIKWGFLEHYLPRITFAISVFHAFGHGWPCQCIYHPRKCKGFGLSDGEGCERFWHSISKLIAYLRVCGHHLRIYTLDLQIQHADVASLRGLASWIVRKWNHTEAKRVDAEEDIRYSMRSVDFLREQWAEQVKKQTQPLPKQSRKAGKTAVEEALRLRTVRDTLSDRVRRLEDITTDLSAEPYEVAEAEQQLTEVKENLRKTSATLKNKEMALGVEGRTQYRHLASSPFIAARMNARSCKLRLRTKLTARKFERDRLERSFRRQMNKRKLHNHTEDAVKRRDPGIEALARRYNNICKSMSEMIRLKRAPANAVAPQPIPTKELFSLDVDDSIWDDIGLDDDTSGSHAPLWQSCDQVRHGIRGILLRDRCDEERRRLQHECLTLREWFSEEWSVLQRAISELHESEDVFYQLDQRRSELCRLCVFWQRAFAVLPINQALPPWGPTEAELAAASIDLDSDRVVDVCEEWMDDDSGESLVDDDDLDVGLLESIDVLNLTDGWYAESEDTLDIY